MLRLSKIDLKMKFFNKRLKIKKNREGILFFPLVFLSKFADLYF